MAREWRDGGEVECYIAADPQTVYERVADVTTTGERSIECRSCEWLPGAAPGTVKARFRGRNRRGLARWSRICEVVEAEPGRSFVYRTIPSRFNPSQADSTTWSYTFTAEGAGTRVKHAYEITKMPPPPFPWLYGLLFPHHGDMRPHMTHTLETLRTQFEETARR